MDESKIYTLKELKEKLTEKEKRFCHEYIIDWNGSRAARVAGYSENSCSEIATQNLVKLHIQQYIDFIKNDFEKEAFISKFVPLKKLKVIIENEGSTHREIVAAIAELNKMMGYNLPEKLEHSGEVKTNPTTFKVIIENERSGD